MPLSIGKPAVSDIAANLAQVRADMAAAATAVERDTSAVTLVAVSKTHGADRITAAITAGQRVFGENRVQEAEDKWPAIKQAHGDVRLHLLGPLQRNKVRKAVRLFDVIESVDRPKLARALADVMAEEGVRPDVLIQVNTGEEAQKAGVMPDEVEAFVAQCRDDLALPVKGLMCVPPVDEEPSLHFSLLREMARRTDLAELSMGMSADYVIAIRCGATLVRVGTAIFGERPAPTL